MTNTTTTLVLGATGATGRRLVAELLSRGQRVRAVVRSPERLRAFVPDTEGLSIVHASVSDASDDELAEHVAGCDAVASCLGHTMSVRGVFGPPYRLVRDTARRVCRVVAAQRPERPVRFVLMSSSGVVNPDLHEEIPLGQKAVITLLRLLVPPHADNEAAAAWFRGDIGTDHPYVEWVGVRPDALVEAEAVTPYELHPSPIRSAIFDAGAASRINVAHFMAALITDDEVWARWKGRMPVLYDTGE